MGSQKKNSWFRQILFPDDFRDDREREMRMQVSLKTCTRDLRGRM